MTYTTVPYTTRLEETLAALDDPGVLLVSARPGGRPNAMVIGWGAIGTIWGKPIFTVMVRPSRFTYGLIEASQEFLVCVPAAGQRHVVDFCGNNSGRDHDKFGELGLAPLVSTQVGVPGVEGCPIVYECRVVASNDLLPEWIVPDITRQFYARDDYHRVYFGEILAVRVLA